MKTINEIITHVDRVISLVPGAAILSDEDWKTLKTAVRAQQKNNPISTPEIKMDNRYGVDVEYFRRELKALLKLLDDCTPGELGRYLSLLSDVATPPNSDFQNVKKLKDPIFLHLTTNKGRKF